MEKSKIKSAMKRLSGNAICALMFILMLSLTSCFRFAVKKVREKINLEYQTPNPTMYADAEFSGLRDFIDQAKDTASIVLVHGLTEKDTTHFDFLVERLSYKLGLKLVHPKKAITLEQKSTNDPANHILGFEKSKLYHWEFADAKPDKIVNFYFIFWSPITRPAKQFIRDYHETEYRTGFSNLAKEEFLIDVFGDLALYLNTSYKVQLHEAFLQSLEKISGDVVVVGGGFGIQIMFEALQLELASREYKPAALKKEHLADQTVRGIQVNEYVDQAPERKFKREYDIRKVFLISNQLPFTSLLTLRPDDPARADSLDAQVYWAITNFCKEKTRRLGNYFSIELVSFYDPNDPFGYRLPPSHNLAITVKNVSVNTAEYWQLDPKKTTDLVMPRLKNPKASEVFLNFIDQKKNTQDLLLNLKAPANRSRNDYRIMGALSEGSKYGFVCLNKMWDGGKKYRTPTVEKRKFLAAFLAKAAERGVSKVKRKLELQASILPFSIPSEYRDTVLVQVKNAKTNALTDSIVPLLSRSFEGIESSVNNNELTQLLTVHGVRNQEPDHFDELTGLIAKSLGFYSNPVSYRIKCAEGKSCDNLGPLTSSYRPGTVKITEFKGVYGKRLIIYNVYLSSITKPAKQWLDSTSIYDESSVVPKMIKKLMITDGFADIELTFQQYKSKVETTLDTAFHAMENDFRSANIGHRTNTYYMSGSLGSRLLLDFIDSHLGIDNYVDSVQRRTKTWFMLTNQLIITALKDVPLNDESSNDHDNAISYGDFYKATYRSLINLVNDSTSSFEIVAFNDPNDLLSFTIPDEVMGVGPSPGKIYNNYLNLAGGVRMNMDALISYARKIDKMFQRSHKQIYEERLEKFKKDKAFVCGKDTYKLQEDNPAYGDYVNILRMAHDRFDVNGLNEFLLTKKDELDKNIMAELQERSDDKDNLGKLLDEKKKWYISGLYVPKDEHKKCLQRYKEMRKNAGRKSIISKKNFSRLQNPGLILPFLRNICNYSHYQDFVVDFGRAHVGAKNSSRIVSLIAFGFDSVAKTNLNQNLYNEVHKIKTR
ncbi:MAG TPA: hypothetical protein VK589_25665 [Chryseolinea sp.]|nr:hypothetical protein [Chryseolinea sp.]